ncbi:hypothetical protein HHK36_004257 [Tetracentron sinense]|uniref:KOW domain-containing protein n=1 Tax=Tetracentron sinense TaxID=13715 RepID=A0A834ZQA6_TETSI|nr:hypothetical protein HHK36_004257 [Tetracentron sinense]
MVDGGAELQDEDDCRRMHRHPPLPQEDDQEDIEALERRIQARYAKSSSTEYDEETTDVYHQALLPPVEDPKLWLVECAREAAIWLMQKYVKGSELKIRSAIALILKVTYISSRGRHRSPCDGGLQEYAKYVMFLVDVDGLQQREKLIPRINLRALADKLKTGELSTLFANRKKGNFMKGDAVIVVKGDVKNLIGWVEKVEEEIVHIMPKMKGLQKTVHVNEKHLCKYFKPGDHVKVMPGALEGVTGMVVKVENHELITVSDTTKIRVFADIVVESSEVTFGVTRIGDYELHDLVLLNNMSFGVITIVESEAFQPEEEVMILWKGRETVKKKTLVPAPRFMNIKGARPGDHVKVMSGALEGVTGMVENHELITIRVFEDIVVESFEVPSGVTRIGDYELHDLVLLNNMSFGVITIVESEAFQVIQGIPNRTEVVLVKLREIENKIGRRTIALDRSKNNVSE